MSKKTKEKNLDLFYTGNENKKTNINKNKKQKHKKTNTDKIKKENTKDNKFNFDEEIIIGLKRIDETDKPEKKEKSKKLNKKDKSKKTKTKNKENTQKLKKKKLTTKQEIKRKVVFRIIKWLTLLAIIIGGIVYALLSPIFNVKVINITGNSKISSDEIISLSKIELEQNIFKYQKGKIKENIKENAYIDTVEITRKLPDTIQIQIKERQAMFMVQVANAYAYISNQGYILEIVSQKGNLPVITGYETIQENIQIGKRLCTEDLKKLNDVLKIMKSANSNKLDTLITEINISDKTNYLLTLEKQNKIVQLGDISNLSGKMTWILKMLEEEGQTAGEYILNMNLNDEKNKPYFRKSI